MLILVVSFAERVLSARVERPLDLLWPGVGIALIALALFLLHAAERERNPGKE